MSGPRDRSAANRSGDAGGAAHGPMAQRDLRYTHTGGRMAHRTHVGPAGLLGRIRALFGRSGDGVASLGAHFDGIEDRIRDVEDVPRTSAEFGSGDAAEVARLNLRSQTIAKVNARAATRGGFAVEGRGHGRSIRAAGTRGGLQFGGSHAREMAAVLAMVVVAGVLSASLPGVSAAPPGAASPSAALMSYGVAAATVVASGSPAASPTMAPSPTDSASPTPGPTDTPVPTKAPAKAATNKVYTFVALGDSLTAWPSGSPWPTRLDALDPHLTLLHNAGVPGDTTAMMLARVKRDVLAYHPQILFVMGGTNDLGHNIPIATTIANLRQIIVAAKAAGIGVFMLKIPPTSYRGEATTIDTLNTQIAQMAYTYKVITIDIHTPLSSSTGVYASKYTVDGVHFTALGAQTVTNTIYYRIKQYGY